MPQVFLTEGRVNSIAQQIISHFVSNDSVPILFPPFEEWKNYEEMSDKANSIEQHIPEDKNKVDEN